MTEERVFDPNSGEWVYQATGTLCLVHGTTCEVWPLEEKEAVLQKCVTVPGFKKDFDNIAVGVEKGLSKNLLRPEHVKRDDVHGIRCYRTRDVMFELTIFSFDPLRILYSVFREHFEFSTYVSI